jgi:hypothetical protein
MAAVVLIIIFILVVISAVLFAAAMQVRRFKKINWIIDQEYEKRHQK